MVEPNSHSELSDRSPSLWLVVKYQGTTFAFDMVAGEHRVVAVGASEHADVRLIGPEVPPVACYFERVGDDLWLVPGYCSSILLRADTRVVAQPQRVWRRAIIELLDITLEVRVREEPPTNPDNAPPIQYGAVTSSAKAFSRQETAHLFEQDLVCGGLTEALHDTPTMRIPTRDCDRSRVALERVDTGFSLAKGAHEVLQASAIVSVGEVAPRVEREPARVSATYEDVPSKATAPSRSAPSSYPLPSSSAPVVFPSSPVSVAPPSLARLGTLATRRPLLVAASAMMGAVMLTAGMLGLAKAIEAARGARDVPAVERETAVSNHQGAHGAQAAAPSAAAAGAATMGAAPSAAASAISAAASAIAVTPVDVAPLPGPIPSAKAR